MEVKSGNGFAPPFRLSSPDRRVRGAETGRWGE